MLIAAALLLVLGLLATLPRTMPPVPIACPWRTMTGISCPGCGGTRALDRLARANIAGAMAMNTPVTLATLGAIFLGATAVAAPAAADRLLAGLTAAGRVRLVRLGLAAVLLAQMVVGQR
jgi:hypothetical protein